MSLTIRKPFGFLNYLFFSRLFFLFSLLLSKLCFGQNMTSTPGGSTTVTSCNTTIYDNGGTGNYSSTNGNFTQVLVPTSSTNILHLTLNVNLNVSGNSSNFDYLWLFTGTAVVSSGSSGSITQTGGTQVWASGGDFTGSFEYYGAPGQTLTLVFQENGSGVNSGWVGNIDCTDASITISSAGNFSSCGTLFTDSGGASGNPNGSFSISGATGYYSNNTTNTYVFCPSSSGTYVSLNFSEFNIDFDRMIILNGNGPASPIIGQYNLTNSPGIITSSASNGCLTVIFISDNIYTAPGWIATISCLSTPGNNSAICSSANCNGGCGYTICSNGAFFVNSGSGAGVQELFNSGAKGCALNGEVNATWYYFKPQASGNLGFILNPPNGLDFDYTIWGPYNNYIGCPMSTGDAPVRCSFASANGSVGLVDGAGDFSEGATGNNFTEDLDVNPNEVYVMLINTYSNGNPSAQPLITWSGSAAPSLSCAVPLPVDLVNFDGYYYEDANVLHWKTQSEYNNDFFTIERSRNGMNWETLSTIQAAGFSNEELTYQYRDTDPLNGVNYYRLMQTDRDGTKQHLGTIALQNNTDNNSLFTNVFPNPANDLIYFNYTGRNLEEAIQIAIYDELGKLIFSKLIEDFNNNKAISLNLVGMSSGLYTMSISQNNEQQVQKFVKF